jgi:hypothetical protein
MYLLYLWEPRGMQLASIWVNWTTGMRFNLSKSGSVSSKWVVKDAVPGKGGV